MSSQAQIDANRLNALKSTGPKTDDGKTRSAMNALKSGLDAQSIIIPGESAEAFVELRDEYYAAHPPAGPEHRYYLDTAIVSDWELRRFKRIEAQLWTATASTVQDPALALGQSLRQDDKTLMRLHRRIVHARKTYDHAMKTVHRLEAAKTPPQPVEIAPPLPDLASFHPADYHGPSDPFLDAMCAHLHHLGVAIGVPEAPDPASDPEDPEEDAAA